MFCLHDFRQAGPPQRVDCLALRWETALSVFPKEAATRYCIEPGFATFRTKSNQGFATFRLLARRLYQLSYAATAAQKCQVWYWLM